MQDRLENFIRENGGQFDELEPRHSVWEKIDVELTDGKGNGINSPSVWLWKVAVVILIGAVAFLLVDSL